MKFNANVMVREGKCDWMPEVLVIYRNSSSFQQGNDFFEKHMKACFPAATIWMQHATCKREMSPALPSTGEQADLQENVSLQKERRR